MDNKYRLIQAVDRILQEEDALKARQYIDGISFKLKVAKRRQRKLTIAVNEFCSRDLIRIAAKDGRSSWVTREKYYRFRYEIEWDHLVCALRSVLDYLAQLINIVYKLGLLPRGYLRRGRRGLEVTFRAVKDQVRKLEDEATKNAPVGQDSFADFLEELTESHWYDYLNSLRVETIHVSPIVFTHQGKITRPLTLPSKTRSDDSSYNNLPPPAVRIDKLLLPDEPWNSSSASNAELTEWCARTHNDVKLAVHRCYTYLIRRLRANPKQ